MDTLTGRWQGSVRLGGETRFIKLHLAGHDAGHDHAAHGTAELPAEELAGVEVTGLVVAAPRVRFELPRPAGPLAFAGECAHGRMSGTVTRGQARGALCLLHTRITDRYLGTYRLRPRRLLSVSALGDLHAFGVIDTESGRLRVLVPPAGPAARPPLGRVFVAGPGVFVPSPAEVTAVFEEDARGAVTGLRWEEAGHGPSTAPRLPLPREGSSSATGGDPRRHARPPAPGTAGAARRTPRSS